MASIDQSSDIEVSEDEIEKVSSPETLSIWGLAWPSILANILLAAVGIFSREDFNFFWNVMNPKAMTSYVGDELTRKKWYLFF